MRKIPKGAILSVSSTKLTKEEIDFFSKINPLGFVLFSRNFINKKQVTNLISSLKKITKNKNALIFVDQEGGRVQRFKSNGFNKFPSLRKLGKIYLKNKNLSKKLTHMNSYTLGDELKQVGVDVNFAPVCDVNYKNAHSIIGDRAFSSNPETVFELTKEFCKGLRDSGILPVLKHFPGHGRSKKDTHTHCSKINVDLDSLLKTDLIPFNFLKKESLLMLAHIIFPRIDKSVVTYSKFFNSIIREKFKFKGLIITDDISMKALSDEIENVVIKSFDAGCDVILYCKGEISEMRKIYPYVKTIEKKYYNFFINDMKNMIIKTQPNIDYKKLLFANNLLLKRCN